jgi:hypothetical protein
MKIPYKDNKKPAAGEAEIFLELHRNFRACMAVASS